MNGNNEEQKTDIKPVFPFLYLIIFVWTVVSTYQRLIFGEVPPLVDSLSGETNQEAAFSIIAIFAFVLCLYNILYYAVLELHEHHGEICSTTPKAVLVLEFVVRFLLVATIALKVLKYEVFDSLFVFATIICFLLVVWLLILRKNNIGNFTAFDLAGSIIVLILAFLASIILSAPAAQVDYAIWLLAISLILTIAFTGMVIYLAARFGRQFFELSKEFIVKWP